jgi:phage-related minor tail protein
MEAQIVANQKLIDLEQQRQSIIDSVTGSVENGMMAMVDGTLSVKDAFKSMASEIIKELYRVLVVQKLVAAAKTAIMGFAEGGVISGGTQVTAYANGGIVGSPTTFPMSGGKTGLMGEDGPEAIMPLKRGANGKLGVQMEGGKGGDNIVIHQNFNFQANGDDTVKKLIAQAAPKIMSMTKTSLIEDRRRGGSTKAAFG